jgi:hypothetical protein
MSILLNKGWCEEPTLFYIYNKMSKMFTLGIPKTQYRRTTQVLGHERSEPIEYNAERQDDGFYMFKFPFADEYDFRDIVKLLKQNGITTIGADAQLTERQIMKLVDLVPLKEMDMNDPVMMRTRAAKMKADKEAKRKANRIDGNEAMYLRGEIADLKDEIKQIYIDMEQEAEPEGGPVADMYGDLLNKAEAKLADMQRKLDDYDMNENTNLIRKAIKKEIKSLNEDSNNKGYQAARNLIDKLREKTYKSFSDEDLDAFSKEMALHFIDNRAAEAALMMRSAKMKGDDYKPGTTDELPFE